MHKANAPTQKFERMGMELEGIGGRSRNYYSRGHEVASGAFAQQRHRQTVGNEKGITHPSSQPSRASGDRCQVPKGVQSGTPADLESEFCVESELKAKKPSCDSKF